MATINIEVSRSSDQKSITVTTTSSISAVTEMVLNFYTNSLITPVETYTLTALELAEFDSESSVTLTFESMFGDEFIQDNWYIVQAIGDDGDYVSNYDGFGVYTWVKTKTFEQINSLHTPESISANIENLFLKKIMLEGLEELDTSTVVSRDIKFKKRLSKLTKLFS